MTFIKTFGRLGNFQRTCVRARNKSTSLFALYVRLKTGKLENKKKNKKTRKNQIAIELVFLKFSN